MYDIRLFCQPSCLGVVGMISLDPRVRNLYTVLRLLCIFQDVYTPWMAGGQIERLKYKELNKVE